MRLSLRPLSAFLGFLLAMGASAVVCQDSKDDSAEIDRLTSRGNLRMNRDDLEGALADFNAVVKLAPKEAKGWYLRGRVYQRQAKPEYAIDDFTEAISIEKNADSYLARGICFGAQKDYKLAVSDFDKAVEMEPARALAWYHRGEGYYHVDGLTTALASFDRAIQLDPLSNSGWFPMSQTLAPIRQGKSTSS